MCRNGSSTLSHLIVLALVVGFSVTGAASAPYGDNPTDHAKDDTTWYKALIDTGAFLGRPLSVAVDSVTGRTFVAYYDGLDGDLWLAREVGSGGNCGPSDSFQCLLIDSDGDVGKYNSIDVVTDSTSHQVHISYHDQSAGALKYARVSITNSGPIFKVTQTIATGGMGLIRGRHTSIKLDSQNTPYIGYQSDLALGDESLYVARLVGNGSGNCGTGDVEGDWQCDLVYSAEGTAQQNSLALSPSGKPRVAFYDGLTGYPKIAAFNGSQWLISTVTRPGKDCGHHVSLYVDDSGGNHIAYVNQTDESLEYASPASGGNCGGGAWDCIVIDDVGPTAANLAIVEDEHDYPMIAYQSTVMGNFLKLARPNAALDTPGGNCGPGVFPLYTWTCSLVAQGTPSTTVGTYLDLDIRETGGAAVAYTLSAMVESDLLVAYDDGFAIFNDRFETGSSSWWSSTSP